jgi:hypothetical protein
MGFSAPENPLILTRQAIETLPASDPLTGCQKRQKPSSPGDHGLITGWSRFFDLPRKKETKMVATDENRRQAMEKGKTPLGKLAKHFETYNRSEGKSPKTVVWYSGILRYLGDYLKAQGLPDDLDHLEVDVVREFIVHLQTKKKWDGHPGLNGGGLGF